MSAPAANDFSEPVMTRHLTGEEDELIELKSSFISVNRGDESALSAFGLLRVKRPTAGDGFE